MSPTLEKLSQQLDQQYDELPFGAHASTKKFLFEVDNVAVTVSVLMERIFDPAAPETEIVYNGKLFIDTAQVSITPPNEQVRVVALEYFKNLDLQHPQRDKAPFQNVYIDGLSI